MQTGFQSRCYQGWMLVLEMLPLPFQRCYRFVPKPAATLQRQCWLLWFEHELNREGVIITLSL